MTISNERLAEIAGIEPADGDPVRVERRKMAAELLSARETIEQLTDDLSLPGYNRLVAERDAARAEVERLSARLADVERQRDELVAAAQPVLARIEPKPSPFQPLLLDLVAAVAAAQPPAEKAEGGA